MSTRNRAILIAASGLVVVLVVVALVFILTIRNTDRTVQADFNSAVATYQQAQTDLQTTLTSAQTASSTADVTVLDDPTVIDNLNAQIASAQAIASVDTTMPSKSADVTRQATALRSGTIALGNQTATLQKAVQDLQTGQFDWANTTLQAGINSARQTYDLLSSRADVNALAALQTQIDAAQSALDSFDTADPSTIGQTAKEMVESLQTAQQAVEASAPMQCAGVTVPVGVDPMVCGNMPDTAITLAPVVTAFGNQQMFSMPSSNIGCTNSGGSSVQCEIKSRAWTVPADLKATCQGGGPDGTDGCAESAAVIGLVGSRVQMVSYTSVPPWAEAMSEKAKIPALKYGSVVNYAPIACLSATDGVTCWSTSSHHGFKINASVLLYW